MKLLLLNFLLTIIINCSLSSLTLAQDGARERFRDRGGDLVDKQNNPSPAIHPANLASVSIQGTAADFSSIEQGLQKSLRFSPPIEVNTNLGNLLTYVDIPLPENFVGMNSLRMNYNSSNPQDIGLGIGWSWQLPIIEFNPYSQIISPYKIRGTWNGTLTATSEEISFIAPKIYALFNLSTNNPTPLPTLQTFRLGMDSDFTLFVRVSSGNNLLGFVALSLEGKQWVFSPQGFPLALYSNFSQPLNFSWENGLLKKVVAPTENFQLLIRYAKQGVPSTYFGNHQLSEQFIKDIQVTYNNLSTFFQFSYQDAYLTKICNPQNPLPLFQADYVSFNSRIAKTSENELAQDDSRKVYYLSNIQEPQLSPREQSQNRTEYFVDLNGDGMDDKLVVDIEEYQKSIREYLRSVEYVEINNVYRAKRNPQGGIVCKGGDLADVITQLTPIKIFMNVWQGSHAEFQEDKSLALTGNELPIFDVEVLEKQNAYGVYYVDVQIKPRGIFFEDLNHDGRKDLISCQLNKSLDQEQIKFSNGKGFYSNFVLSVLEKFNKLKFGNRSFTRIWSDHGKPATALLNLPNEQKLSDIFEKTKDGPELFGHGQYVLNASIWSKVSTEILCNQHSLFIDHNRDGYIDVVTGDQIQYLDKNLNAQNKSYLTNELFDENSFSKVEDLTSHSLTFFDLEGTGKLHLVEANAIKVNPLSGLIEFWRPGITESIIPASGHKYIRHFYSAFEGLIQVRYKFQSGRYVVQKIIHLPRSEYAQSWEQVFAYNTPIKDPYSGVFLGFYKTTEMLNYFNDHVENKTIQRFFRKDTHPMALLFQERGRLNGELIAEKVSGLDPGSFQKKIFHTELIPLSHYRVWPRRKAQETHQTDGSVTSSRYEYSLVEFMRVQDQILPRKIKNLVSDGPTIPLHLSANSGDLAPNIMLSESQFEFYPEIFQSHQISNFTKRGRGHAQWNHYSYNQKSGRLKQFSQGDQKQRFIRYQYDTLDRLIREEHSNGKVIEANYFANTPKIESYKGAKGVETYRWDYLNNQVIDYQHNKKHLRYTHLGDILTKIEKFQDNGLLTIFSTQINSKGDCANFSSTYSCLEREIYLQEHDITKTVTLDGLGRFVKTEQPYQDGTIVDNLSFYVGPDYKVLSSSPHLKGQEGDLREENFFDYLGRPKLKIQFPTNSQGLNQEIRFQYQGNCVETFTNGIFSAKSCSDFESQTNFTQTPNEIAHLEVGTNGEILSTKADNQNLLINYLYEDFGSLKDALSESEGQDYRSFFKSFTYTPDGKTKTSQFQETWRYNSFGQLTESLASPEFKFQVSSNLQYKDSELTLERLWYGDLQNNKSKKLIFQKNQLFDEEGQLKIQEIDAHSKMLAHHFDYDTYGRLLSETLKDKNFYDFQVDYDYKFNLVSKVNPFFNQINYDNSLSIKNLANSSGFIKHIEKYPGTNLVKEIHFTQDGKTIWQESLHYNNEYKISERRNLSALFGETKNLYNYTSEGELSVRPINKNLQKNIKLKIKNEYVSEIQTKEGSAFTNFYTIDGNFVGSCPKGVDFHQSQREGKSQCFIKLSQYEALYQGNYLRLHVFLGQAIALQVNQNFYYVIEDIRGSIRGLISPEGELLFERLYSPWGEKQVRFRGKDLEFEKNLERLTLWSFAKLMHNPLYEEKRSPMDPTLYWSATRIYNADSGLWLTTDSAHFQSPDQLATHPGNWHNLRYAANDPVNFIDPVGGTSSGILTSTILGTFFSAFGAGIIGGFTDNVGSFSIRGFNVSFLTGLAFSGFGTGTFMLMSAYNYTASQSLIASTTIAIPFSTITNVISQKIFKGDVDGYDTILALTSLSLSNVINLKLKDMYKKTPELLIDAAVNELSFSFDLLCSGIKKELTQNLNKNNTAPTGSINAHK